MYNMLIRPTPEELDDFGDPDFTIYNAGAFPCNRHSDYMSSSTHVGLSFKHMEMVILGTQYAGCMKKGVFTVMNYVLPKLGVLSMHSGCNVGEQGDVTIFFGLSGTGKTTLSADPRRPLIGDDEHGWSDEGVFNIEGGCYAKCINLDANAEPDIYNAIRFGTVLENVVIDTSTQKVDFTDSSITENTRASYPIEYINNALVPCKGPHPKNIIMLTCDAFGEWRPLLFPHIQRERGREREGGMDREREGEIETEREGEIETARHTHTHTQRNDSACIPITPYMVTTIEIERPLADC